VPGRRPTYPWDRWFEEATGEWKTIIRGKDFHCSVLGITQQIRNRAVDRGLVVSVSAVEDGIIKFKIGRY